MIFVILLGFISNSNIKNINSIAQYIILYKYNNYFYLVLSNINSSYKYIKLLLNTLTEFGTYKCNANLFSRKLIECGEVFIKNNAIKICQKYFI